MIEFSKKLIYVWLPDNAIIKIDFVDGFVFIGEFIRLVERIFSVLEKGTVVNFSIGFALRIDHYECSIVFSKDTIIYSKGINLIGIHEL